MTNVEYEQAEADFNMCLEKVRSHNDSGMRYDIEMNTIMSFIASMVFIIMCIAILFLSTDVSRAEPISKSRIIDAIIGEAESGGLDGMRCVASAINNRNSLRGVYGEKSKRVTQRMYSSKTLVKAVQAYEDAKHRDYSNGATFWFSDEDLKQKNVKRIIRLEKLRFVKRCSGNNFYRRDRL